MHERARDALLSAWGRRVSSHPYLALAACLLLAAGGIVLTVRELEFRPDRDDLIAQDLAWNQLYARYKSRFDRWDDLIVCLDGDPADERVDALGRAIAETVRADPRVLAADAGFAISEVGPRLFAVAPEEIFQAILDQLAAARPIVEAPNANAALTAALGALAAGEAETPDGLARLEDLLAPYLAALAGETPAFAFMQPEVARWQPYVSGRGSGRLRFVLVQFGEESAGIDRLGEDIAWLRGEIGDVVAASGIRGVTWGVTGVPAIEADETEQSIHDSTLASLVAFVLITALMVVVFRGVVVPALAATALLIGLAWSFGWLVIAVGHLQLLSVVFSVILLGLGIDFALHLVARLELVQDEHDDLPAAIERVFRGIGPGLITGAVTTAAAFGATALTQFKGMAEMGIIAGGGILLCLVAVLTSFPAMLAITRRWKQIIRHRAGGETAHFAHGWLDSVDFHPKAALVVAAIAVGLAVIPALRVRYDPNVLNLHPPGIESVVWERRLVDDDAGSVWSALVETDADSAPALVDRLRALPEVAYVNGMGVLLPADRAERAARIAVVRDRPMTPADAPPGLEQTRRQLAAVRLGLDRRVAGAAPETAAALRAIAERIAGALSSSARVDAAEAARRFAILDERFRAARDSLTSWIDAALDSAPPGPDDLPRGLREQWDRDGVWLLQVAPTPDPAGLSILDPRRLEAFVTALRTVAPDVLGPPVQIYESSLLIKREYIKAAGYAVIAILVLLLLDFRSLADALCAMLPVLIGFIGAFGLMGLFGVPLNFANIIVMPLIFGIGVDAGVHAVHRWRAEPYRRPAGLSGGTGRGITLTMLSTMIGFGAMLLAEHRGIRSLGFVMLAGLGVTLLGCYLVLPAVLRLRTAHWSVGDRER